MRMPSFIKDTYHRTEGPINYLGSIIQIASIFWSIFLSLLLFVNIPATQSIKTNFQEINPLIKGFIVLALLLILIYLINNLYRKAKFIVNVNKLTNNIKREVVNQEMNQLIDNYSNIIPSSLMMQEVYQELLRRARKWGPDAYLVDQALDIWVKVGAINVNLVCDFFSQKKKTTVKFTAMNMKIPVEGTISPKQLRYTESQVEMTSFLLNNKWRKFVIDSLERIEGEIAGHEFYLSISSWIGGIVRFYLDPGFTPSKSFQFFLRNREVFKDIPFSKVVTKL